MSALAGWSTDIKAAPHGRYVVKQRREGVDQRVFVPERVILTTKCGKVTLSHYLPEEKRWLMLGHGEAPVAWMAWPKPYPHLPSGAAACAADTAGAEIPPSVLADQFESDAEAEIARLESVIEKSGGIGNALSDMLCVDVEIVRADAGADIIMKYTNIAGVA